MLMTRKSLIHDFYTKLLYHNFACDAEAIRLSDDGYPMAVMPYRQGWLVEMQDLGNSLGVVVVTPSGAVQNFVFSWFECEKFQIFRKLFLQLQLLEMSEVLKNG
jgi:hypothetical protein